MKKLLILLLVISVKTVLSQTTTFTPAMVNTLGGSGDVGVVHYDFTVGEPVIMFGGTGCDTIFSGFQHCAIDTPRVKEIVINANNSTTFCLGQNVTLSVASGASYLWSNGATTQNINATRNGTYSVRVINTCGDTTRSDSVVVTTINPPAVSICIVTVDTASLHNIIVWDKTGLTRIDSFKIYFQNSSSVWQLIKEVPFSAPNYIIDSTPINNPNANTVKYLLTDIDSCGNEEPQDSSLWQNTPFIIGNGSGTFSWSGTGYLIQGVTQPVKTYRLFRDTLSNGNWQAIDSVSGIQNQMTDPNYSKYPYARYRLDGELVNGGCPYNELRPVHANNSSTSRSNTQHNGTFTGIKSLSNSSSIMVYPNPACQNLNIKFGDVKTGIADIQVSDVTGREIYSMHNYELSNQDSSLSIDVSKLPEGIYFVKVTTNLVSSVVKFVKE